MWSVAEWKALPKICRPRARSMTIGALELGRLVGARSAELYVAVRDRRAQSLARSQVIISSTHREESLKWGALLHPPGYRRV